MKTYIAGRWHDKEKISQIMDQYENKGFTITHRWNEYEADPKNKLEDMAVKDIDAVRESDVVLVIMDDSDYIYRGTFTEIGAAIALRKDLIVYCPDEKAFCRTNCFFHHPHIQHCETMAQVDELMMKLKNKKES